MSSVPAQPRPALAITEAARAAQRAQALIQIEARVREARRVEELAFTIANETWQLLPYRQAFVWLADARGRDRLATVSGLAQLAEDSPFTVWLKRVAKALKITEPKFLTPTDLPEALRESWAEWLPPQVLAWPLIDRNGTRLGAAWFALESLPDDATQEALGQAMDAYGYALGVLRGTRRVWRGVARFVFRLRWVVLAAAIGALFIPVRMSVLAPAEVAPVEAMIVAAPMDGVVKTFHVRPNADVKKGERLFTLDDTTLRNRREVALKQLAVARADALATAQKSFDSAQSRGELAVLNGKVRERQAEVAYLDEQLGRVEIRAPRDGIAVFGDPTDWQGKPVTTGERVILLADPADAGVLMWLPVADAINLAPGAEVRLFLSTAPLVALPAKLTETSYQTMVSPEGVAAYRLRGRFDGAVNDARIGLKGTAKIYGEQASLGYYLFRRPLAALRQWTGL